MQSFQKVNKQSNMDSPVIKNLAYVKRSHNNPKVVRRLEFTPSRGKPVASKFDNPRFNEEIVSVRTCKSKDSIHRMNTDRKDVSITNLKTNRQKI